MHEGNYVTAVTDKIDNAKHNIPSIHVLIKLEVTHSYYVTAVTDIRTQANPGKQVWTGIAHGIISHKQQLKDRAMWSFCSFKTG